MPGAQDPAGRVSGGERRVASSGLSLAVCEYGDRTGAEHVVLAHGYPDNQRMWEPVARLLAEAGLHVVTYDVRGAGASQVPARVEDYRVELLVEDLVAVVEATVPDRHPVHLVGHDWGSVQLWEAVLSEPAVAGLTGRIASFTAVSGPAIDHFSHLLRHPRGRWRRVLRQLGHSWYVLAFQVPFLPELAWRTASRPLALLATRADRAHRSGPGRFWGPELAGDAARGVNLYRANLHRGARRPPRRTEVPVLVVAPRRDPFLTDLVVEDLGRVCTRWRVERPDSGHWLPRTDPHLLAGLVAGQVRATTGG